jgi:hypothetical protein
MSLTSVTALIVALLFILPGTVYQIVRTSLRGPSADHGDSTGRLSRAVAASVVLVGIYIIAFGPTLVHLVRGKLHNAYSGVEAHTRAIGVWGLTLLVIVPAVIAYAECRLDRWRNKGHAKYDPTPNAWEFGTKRAFNRPGYVRVLTENGTWVGGYIADQSHATGYPESPSLFIERAHYMNDDGSLGDRKEATRGTYVRCDNAVVVEFLDGTPIAPTAEGGDASDEQRPRKSPHRWTRRDKGLDRAGREGRPDASRAST